ncbi:MAG: hypothetical protein M3O29_03700, partial [Actinomycetota bacterium]|nr:hypothetical protein [Actinomycetota bacterium]
MNAPPPPQAAELFRIEPERFVAERDALAKRLRAEGREDDAKAVKALRKPTAVVWALNQLAAREPDGLTALFDSGRALRSAQQAALTGSGGDDLVTASGARRAAVSSLTAAAMEILEDVGHRGASQADALASALEVASIDPDAGAQLGAGTLEKAPAAAVDLGFGDMPAMATLPGGIATPADTPSRADLARARRERDAARKTAISRRATADRLAGQVDDLTARLERLTTEHAAAE